MPDPVTTFGPYRLLARLGKGATSELYRATRGPDPHEIALKILLPAATEDGEWLRRFEREAHVMRRLQHPNIITWLDFGESEGRWFLAMEFVQGRGGRSLVGGHPKAASLARLGAQIASGLLAAHAQGLIHRDLKPENLIVTKEGIVKILDFGLARPIRPDAIEFPEHLARLTATGMLVGTPRYMSPEQVRGEPLTPATDLFCLGLCLFEIATGRHPFASDFHREVMAGIVETQTPPLKRWRPDLTAALIGLIEELLAKNPSERPAADVTFQRFKTMCQH